MGLDQLAPVDGGLSVAIGTFDGVHVGHRALIGRAMDKAHSNGWSSGVITWDRHPNETVRPDHVPPLLTSTERKTELLESLGIDVLVVLPFDDRLRNLSAPDFVKDVLAKGLGVDAVHVGHGWRFGHKAMGNVELLTDLGRDLGYEVEELGLIEVSGGPASSSRSREAVQRGDLDLAHALLTRPFDLDGQVVQGDRRGTDLGVPTANVFPEAKLVRPPRGIYACRVRAKGDWYAAATNVGVNPTFGGDPDSSPIRIEPHLLDFSGDLYGETIRIEFHKRLRDELDFDSVDDLVAQMKLDIDDTRSLITGAG
ncbi:MAG: riboflavin kinase / adenylyltransferase [Actinomycetota bacterium]|nr:riboflavin kinase / adenylyltransferase [Actinomycetota bacterium]